VGCFAKNKLTKKRVYSKVASRVKIYVADGICKKLIRK
jgi:hypothetical protein